MVTSVEQALQIMEREHERGPDEPRSAEYVQAFQFLYEHSPREVRNRIDAHTEELFGAPDIILPDGTKCFSVDRVQNVLGLSDEDVERGAAFMEFALGDSQSPQSEQ